ncbi:MAG: TonB-dependent receptor plug domain-containing protein [Treponema sp.]|jgi:vitamin B12 transporter|nr:TonB-dependent receptor plug domain-containing protein [Treponema sp.]
MQETIAFPGFASLCALLLFAFHPLLAQEPAAQEPARDFPEDALQIGEDEGITIAGSPEATRQTRIVTKEDIERIHAPTITALLEELFNLGATSYGPYGNAASVNMRGLGAGRAAILVDGAPVNSAQSGTFNLESVGVNAIERIEVMYGGADTKFNVSGAMGGVINIVTVKQQRQGLRFGGGVSNTGALPGAYQKRDGSTGDAECRDLLDAQNVNAFVYKGWNAGAAGEYAFSASVFANRAENHFLFNDYYGIKRRRNNNEVWDAGTAISLSGTFADLTRLVYSGSLYYGDKNTPGTMTAVNYGKQRDFSTRNALFLDNPAVFRPVFRDNLAVEASVSYARERIGYEDIPLSANGASLHTLCALQAANRWSWYAAKTFTLKTGWDYAYNRLDSTNTGVQEAHTAGVYLTGEWGGAVQIIPSVKLVFSGGALVPVPKLGFAWQATGNLSLFNNYFRVFKLPTFNDRHWSGDATAKGNPGLRPEDGWGADIGALYNGAFTLDIAVYASYVKDSIHWRSASGVWMPVNIGAAAFFGADARIQKKFSLSNGKSPGFIRAITPSFSYQYLLSYILTEGLTFASGVRMPYMPEHAFGVALDAQWKTGFLRLSGHYTGMRYTETLNITALKPYFLLNLTINQTLAARTSNAGRPPDALRPHITLFCVLRNMLNVSYVSVQDYPMQGFTATIGVKAAFEK